MAYIYSLQDDPYDINLIYDIKTQNIKELSKVSSDNNFYTTGSNSQSETYSRLEKIRGYIIGNSS